jgi:uncharacterized protein YfbU (UPF0304 family)
MARKSERNMLRDKFINNEVREIFAMFRALRRSYDAIPDKSGIEDWRITFDGFDANNDTEQEYLRIGRELGVLTRDIRVFNSHMPRLPGYEMMLQEWRNSRDKENLTKEDILRICKT